MNAVSVVQSTSMCTEFNEYITNNTTTNNDKDDNNNN